MGNASSIDSSIVIYLEINGKAEKIVFSKHCCTRDIHELVAQAASCSKYCVITLKDVNGAHVSLSPVMPCNTPSTPYRVTVNHPTSSQGDSDILTQLMSHVAEQFNKAFKVEEMKSEISSRLTALERKLELEGLKAVEIEKCKKDISEIKDQIWTAQKKFVDFNRMSSLSDERKICLKRDIPAYPKYILSQETIDYLKQPTFDIWHWEPNEMLSLLEHMHHELGLVKDFSMNPVTLKRWLMMYGMVHLCRLYDYMPIEEIGILITACVCHDLDHPGYNNTEDINVNDHVMPWYQINARTELAIRYNDISPLENHHCSVAFQILSNPETNIFSNLDKETFKRIRAGITQLILATDMARHSEIIENFKAKLDGKFDFKNKEHLDTLKMVLIKCCDISNEVRPMEVSEPWLDCLLEEYFNQSDREKEEGLPVAPFMDRDKVTKPTAQTGFIKFVLIPMFETVAKLFPQIDSIMVEPLRQARDRYEGMKEHTSPQKSRDIKEDKKDGD